MVVIVVHSAQCVYFTVPASTGTKSQQKKYPSVNWQGEPTGLNGNQAPLHRLASRVEGSRSIDWQAGEG